MSDQSKALRLPGGIPCTHPSASPYLKQLDGLRAFAVAAVLVTHWFPAKWQFGIPWGNYGVHLFFVLSGFLITRILLGCRQNSGKVISKQFLNLRQFYIRRLLRIFPLFYAVLIAVALVNIPPVRETFSWHAAYLSNVYFFLTQQWGGATSHFWSLAVEEQFYLIWPWLILFAPKALLGPMIFACIGIAPVLRFIFLAFFSKLQFFSVLTPFCLDSLGIGAGLAFLAWDESTRVRAMRYAKWAIMLVVGLSFALFSLGYGPQLQRALWPLVMAIAFAALIAKATTGISGPLGWLLEIRPIVYIGKISYGIYVMHNFTPVIWTKIGTLLEWHFLFNIEWMRISGLCLVTLLCAGFSWRFFEGPINDLKRFWPYKPVSVLP